jgi:hypothetical protein
MSVRHSQPSNRVVMTRSRKLTRLLVLLVLGWPEAWAADKHVGPRIPPKGPKHWDGVYILTHADGGPRMCPQMTADLKTIPVVEKGEHLQKYELGPSKSQATVLNGRLSIPWKIRLGSGPTARVLDLGQLSFAIPPDGTIDDSATQNPLPPEALEADDVDQGMKTALSDLKDVLIEGEARVDADKDRGWGREIRFTLKNPREGLVDYQCHLLFIEKDKRDVDAKKEKEETPTKPDKNKRKKS